MPDSRSPVAHDQRFSALEFKEIGATVWNRLPGVGSWSEEQGDTPTTDVVTTMGARTLTGTPPVPTFSIELPAAPLGHPSFNALRDYRRNGTTLNWRLPHSGNPAGYRVGQQHGCYRDQRRGDRGRRQARLYGRSIRCRHGVHNRRDFLCHWVNQRGGRRDC